MRRSAKNGGGIDDRIHGEGLWRGDPGAAVSAFFCREMLHASDAAFSYQRERGMSRVILTGPEDQVAEILRDYYKGE